MTVKKYTVKKYIEDDLPFYHITPFVNRLSIIESGLSRMGNIQGICVVRRCDQRVINLITVGQLGSSDNSEDRYCILKLLPSKHRLGVADIKRDITSEKKNPLHNYIKKDVIVVNEEGILIENVIITTKDIPYFQPVVDELINEGLITELEYNF